jgi:hypothetical protein
MALKNFIKENFVLVVGLTLPVLLVVLFFVASVLPKSMAMPPQYEMLFTVSDYQPQQPYGVDFFIKDSAITARITKSTIAGQNFPRKKVMVFDGKTQNVRELSYDTSKIGDVPNGTEIVFDEFKNFKIDSSNKAPDGYSFDNNGYGSGGLVTELFAGGYNRNGARVTKGAAAFKIPNSNNGSYYYYDIQFLGWVIQK